MQPINQNNNFLFQSVFEALEERVLFDGVPDAAFVLPADAALEVPAQVQSLHQADVDMPRELIIVDPGVENSDVLLSEILEKQGDSAFEIRLLDSNSDGVQQITDLLAAANGKYDAIHVISHGNEGQINLGNTQLTSDSLSGYTDELASWSSALTDDADILFYGCDLAGNAEGEEFIESISAITGADVAASDDLTGAADLGGDWDLEVETGTIQTQTLSATNFEGTLADFNITGAELTAGLEPGLQSTTVTKDGFVVTFAQTSGTDGLMNDGALGVGFARNSDAIESQDYEITLDGDVSLVEVEFGFLNNDDQDAARGGNSGPDGIEQLYDFRVFDTAGNDITTSVTIALVDNSTQGGLSFQASSTLNATQTRSNALVPDGPPAVITNDPLVDRGSFGENTNGVLSFTSSGAPIASITFSQENIADADAGDDLPFGVVLESIGFSETTVSGTPPVATADGTVAVTGNITENIDVLDNDVDADGDALAVTAIVDIQDGGNVLSFAGAGSSVTLASGTVVELQADGTLNVTTTTLGFGPETFDYMS